MVVVLVTSSKRLFKLRSGATVDGADAIGIGTDNTGVWESGCAGRMIPLPLAHLWAKPKQLPEQQSEPA